ncbi:hypothetical protein DYI21_13820 [Thalassospira tepidiphila]|nr:hypothetical protein [Thalassospira tepidiphila]
MYQARGKNNARPRPHRKKLPIVTSRIPIPAILFLKPKNFPAVSANRPIKTPGNKCRTFI